MKPCTRCGGERDCGHPWCRECLRVYAKQRYRRKKIPAGDGTTVSGQPTYWRTRAQAKLKCIHASRAERRAVKEACEAMAAVGRWLSEPTDRRGKQVQFPGKTADELIAGVCTEWHRQVSLLAAVMDQYRSVYGEPNNRDRLPRAA